MTERERFEAFCKAQGLSLNNIGVLFVPDENPETQNWYSGYTRYAWEAWKERSKYDRKG